MAESKPNAYTSILSYIFNKHYEDGADSFEFEREELVEAAEFLGMSLPKNLGDLIYSFRFRTEMPSDIKKTERDDREWIIELAGKARYRFRLAAANRIVPREDQYEIKIPDATPEVIRQYAMNDEQALLARVRYNRLVDIFLGVTAYSLQNHLRTTVPRLGQVETDEIYVAIRKTGEQFIIPVQAKGGSDQLGYVQLQQDQLLCEHHFPSLTPRLVAVQFMRTRDVVVMFEIVVDGDELKVMEERHYRLVPASEISGADLRRMATQD